MIFVRSFRILKASSDLERLADHAVSIAKNVLLLKEERRDDEIDMMIVKMVIRFNDASKHFESIH